MSIYGKIIFFYFSRYLTYPLEIVGLILRRIIEVGLVILFWVVVIRSSEGNLDMRHLLTYFLIATSLTGILGTARLMFTKMITDSVKNGSINNYLTKPLPLPLHLYSIHVGKEAVGLLFSFITLDIGIILAQPLELHEWFFFIIAFALSLVLAFALNLLVGTAAFYTPEATGIRHTFSHAARLFGGTYAPISLFPEPLRAITLASPFPGLVYVPSAILTESLSQSTILHYLSVSGVWAAILLTVSLAFWSYSLRRYDAVGI